MDFNETIAIIGGGNIGMSIAQGLVNAGKYKPEQIIITRKKSDLPKDRREGGFVFQEDNADAVSKARIVVFSVVPHIYESILNGIKDAFTEKHTLITIVTGVEIAKFQAGGLKNYYRNNNGDDRVEAADPSNNKPFGYEITDGRIGWLIKRIDTAATKINEYLEGKVSNIPELDEETLPYNDYPDDEPHCFNIWSDIVTTNKI